MNATARARAALALLTAVSAALWAAAVFDHMSARDDCLDLAAAVTVTIVTAGAASSAARARADRQARVRNLALMMPIIEQVTRPGDGGQAPQQQDRPAWYRRVPA